MKRLEVFCLLSFFVGVQKKKNKENSSFYNSVTPALLFKSVPINSIQRVEKVLLSCLRIIGLPGWH